MAVMFCIAVIWVTAIVASEDIASRKGRAGWGWGLLLGWVGVLVVSKQGPAAWGGQHKSFRLTKPVRVPAVATASDTPFRAGLAPAGWYADPAESGQMRYWGGATWTHYMAAEPTPRPALARALPSERATRPELVTSGLSERTARPALTSVGSSARR
jgi:hypothetical protein